MDDLQVTMFQRRPLPGQRSVERVFEDVRGALPADVQVTTHILPYESRGVVKRLRNIFFVYRRRGVVNHVTGDVAYITLGLPRKSTILTVLDSASLHRLRGLRREILMLLWFRLPIYWSAKVTAISAAARDELVDLVGRSASKAVVIPCPVPSTVHLTAPPNHEVPRILQVGTGANKNLNRAAAALESLPVHLRIIGPMDESQTAHLQSLKLDYSSVHDLSAGELAAEYIDCDVVVFASTYEGFGLPILEAQASGRPVVTSTVMSMPEVAGDGALLVDPFEINEIRAAVSALLDDSDLRTDLVRRGLRNVERFSASAVASAYTAVYRSVERGRPRSNGL